jgi:hypothetical protein
MNNESSIQVIDAHSKRNRCDDHLDMTVSPLLMCFLLVFLKELTFEIPLVYGNAQ